MVQILKKRTKKAEALRLILPLLLLFTLLTAVPAGAEDEDAPLSLPAFTETDCVWDQYGNLISETAHDLRGFPALNSRGFCRAEYMWDENGNMLSEAYFGLDGKPVTADSGYASAVYTYRQGSNGESYVLTEDRYAPDGSRADIPGGYSYRRDSWSGELIQSSEYFDAAGHLTRPIGGYAQVLYSLDMDEFTYTVTKRYLNADGTPLVGTEGGAVVVSVVE